MFTDYNLFFSITEELTTQNSKVTSMEDVFKYSHQKNTSGFAFNVPSKVSKINLKYI